MRIGYRLATVWWFVRRPTTYGVKLVIRDNDRVIFVRHTYGPAVWELPGGGQRGGEHAAATAQREAREELGLRLTTWRSIGVSVDQSFATAHLTCLTADYSGEPITTHPGEIASWQWGLIERPPEPLGRHAAACLRLVRSDARHPSV